MASGSYIKKKSYTHLLALILALALNACASTSYVGDRYAPSEHVDVYYSVNDVKREYKVIGHLSEKSTGVNADERAKQQIIGKGKEVGADGVIILGFEYVGTDDITRYQKAEAIKYIDK
ncbi:hypothetical protein [Parapedobacter koreensis]|uniref:Lipoprotein n=1 Tax=Parapedobacter koreensis TaxID=332977 RepID=A0A1H7PY30_9SPHI|nr:hypothetical protein [Parapedobacter koreensis]SEL40652.1 hypothetical protein SAMN05421740_10573 [Parapedobacter koreensis]